MDLNKEISGEFYFGLVDGRVLKSVPELLEALKNMDDWVYQHHVNQERNDFVNWIRHVYENEELAKKLEKAKKQKQVIKVINESLKKKLVLPKKTKKTSTKKKQKK